jgi:hypothetical protein
MRTYIVLFLLAGLGLQAGAEAQPLLSPSLHVFGVYGSSSAQKRRYLCAGGIICRGL